MAPSQFRRHFIGAGMLAFMLAISFAVPLSAQSGDSVGEMNQKVEALIKKTDFVDALPLLEKLVVAEPMDAGHQYYLGHALIGQDFACCIAGGRHGQACEIPQSLARKTEEAQ